MEGRNRDAHAKWSPMDVKWDGLNLTAQTPDGGDSAVPSIDKYYIKGRFSGNSTSASAPSVLCRVPGCTSDLSRDLAYFRKYRICREHLKCPVLVVEGVPSRFCQQCSRFHNVRDFDGPQRTCRTMLERLRMKRSGKAPGTAEGGCSRRGKRKDIQRADTQQHASSSRSTFSDKEWEAPAEQAPAPSDAAVHPAASGDGADSAAVMAAPLPGGTSDRANSASSAPNNMQPLKRQQKQRARQGQQHELQEQDTRRGTVDEAAMSGPSAPMSVEAEGNGANGVGAAADNPQVGMLQLLLMHNSDCALLPLRSGPTIGATALANAPTIAAGAAAVVSGTVAAAAGSAGAAVGFACDGALQLHAANNQAQAKIQTVSSLVSQQLPYGSNANATSGGIGVKPLLMQRSEPNPQNQQNGMLAYGAVSPGKQCFHAEAGLLHHTLVDRMNPAVCSCGSSGMATDSELEMQLRAIYQEMAMGDEAPLLPLRHQLFLQPQAQQQPQQKHPLVTATSAPPCIPLRTSSGQPQNQNLLQTSGSGVIPANISNAALNGQAGPPHLPATPPSAAFQDLLPLLMDMEIGSASGVPVGAGGMGGFGGVSGISAAAGQRAAVLQQQQTRGVEAVARLHGGLPSAHALQQQHAMGAAFVESEPWQPAAAPYAQPFANVTRMSYGSGLNMPCLAASGLSIPASGLTLPGPGEPNIPMSGPQLARPGGANLPFSGLTTPGSAGARLPMTGLSNSGATNPPLYGLVYPGSGPAVGVPNTASAGAAVPAAAIYAGEKAMQVMWGGDFPAADAAAAGDSSGCCPEDIDAALEVLMEDAGPGAIYSNYEHETATLERVCFKLHNVHPRDLPPNVFSSLRSWLAAAPVDLVQGAIRPGCTQLILDVYVLGGASRATEGENGDTFGTAAVSSRTMAAPPSLRKLEASTIRIRGAEGGVATAEPFASAEAWLAKVSGGEGSTSSAGSGGSSSRVLGGISAGSWAAELASASAAGMTGASTSASAAYGGKRRILEGLVPTQDMVACLNAAAKAAGAEAVPTAPGGDSGGSISGNARAGYGTGEVREDGFGVVSMNTKTLSAHTMYGGNVRLAAAAYKELLGSRAVQSMTVTVGHELLTISGPDMGRHVTDLRATVAGMLTPLLLAVSPMAVPAGTFCEIRACGSHLTGSGRRPQIRCQGNHVACTFVPISGGSAAAAGDASSGPKILHPAAAPMLAPRLVEATLPGSHRTEALAECCEVAVRLTAPDAGLMMLEWEEERGGGASVSEWLPVLAVPDAQMAAEINNLATAKERTQKGVRGFLVDFGMVLDFSTRVSQHLLAPRRLSVDEGQEAEEGGVGEASEDSEEDTEEDAEDSQAGERRDVLHNRRVQTADQRALQSYTRLDAGGLPPDAPQPPPSRPRLFQQHLDRVAPLVPQLLGFAADSGLVHVLSWLLDFGLEYVFLGDLTALFQAVEALPGAPARTAAAAAAGVGGSSGRGGGGLPLLHRVVRSGNARAVRLLMTRSASHGLMCNWVHASGPYRLTPLHLAALQPFNTPLLQTCYSAGPHVLQLWATVKDAAGRTPAMYLRQQVERSLRSGTLPTHGSSNAPTQTSQTGSTAVYCSWGSDEPVHDALAVLGGRQESRATRDGAEERPEVEGGDGGGEQVGEQEAGEREGRGPRLPDSVEDFVERVTSRRRGVRLADAVAALEQQVKAYDGVTGSISGVATAAASATTVSLTAPATDSRARSQLSTGHSSFAATAMAAAAATSAGGWAAAGESGGGSRSGGGAGHSRGILQAGLAGGNEIAATTTAAAAVVEAGFGSSCEDGGGGEGFFGDSTEDWMTQTRRLRAQERKDSQEEQQQQLVKPEQQRPYVWYAAAAEGRGGGVSQKEGAPGSARAQVPLGLVGMEVQPERVAAMGAGSGVDQPERENREFGVDEARGSAGSAKAGDDVLGGGFGSGLETDDPTAVDGHGGDGSSAGVAAVAAESQQWGGGWGGKLSIPLVVAAGVVAALVARSSGGPGRDAGSSDGDVGGGARAVIVMLLLGLLVAVFAAFERSQRAGVAQVGR